MSSRVRRGLKARLHPARPARGTAPRRAADLRRGSVRASWAFLAVAVLLDVAETFALDLSDGFRRVGPVVLAVAIFALALYAFARALERIDTGVAYALFGASTGLTAVVSFTVFGEPFSAVKGLAVASIVAGVVVLQVAAASEQEGDSQPGSRVQ